jgi:hypothetical protein
MQATAALSIAALVATLIATPADAIERNADNSDEDNDLDAAANASLRAWLTSNGIDAASVIAIDVRADGSAEVCEG